MPNYTTEDLIQYLYKETSKDQSLAIRQALETDWTLQEKVDALKASMQGLDRIKKSPRQESIDAILNYARSNSEVVQD
jgi:hypothetical protein